MSTDLGGSAAMEPLIRSKRRAWVAAIPMAPLRYVTPEFYAELTGADVRCVYEAIESGVFVRNYDYREPGEANEILIDVELARTRAIWAIEDDRCSPPPPRQARHDPGRRRLTNVGVIYVIQQQTTNAIKVGYTTDAISLRSRIRSIATGSPYQLSVLMQFPGTQRDEAAIHAALKEHRLRGEWFCDTPAVLEYLRGRQ